MLLVTAAVVAGCGGSSPSDAGGLSATQRQALIAQLEVVRTAAATRDRDATHAAIGRFRQSVGHLRRTGALTASQARALRIGAARIVSRFDSDNPAPAPATTQTTPAPAPTPPPGQAKKKHKPGKGHGKKEKDD